MAGEAIAVYADVDVETFRADIAARYAPAILKGVAADWPLVRAALAAPGEAADYLRARDEGREGGCFIGAPEIGGRFFYGADMRGFNFERRPASLTALLDRIEAGAGEDESPALYMGSTPVDELIPAAAPDMTMALLPAHIRPRLWVGNAITVSAHYDLSDNIAVVAAGRRRFTLFPPDQVENLYVGPLDHTIAGQPVAMADPDTPDFERHPKFRQALDKAVIAELAPGDAIYIPALWWHHVRSLSPLNVLVNYWWDSSPMGTGTAFEALVHAMLGVRDLPPERRDAFKAMFDHFVFSGQAAPSAHLPAEAQGVLGPMTPEQQRRIRTFLTNALVARIKGGQQ